MIHRKPKALLRLMTLRRDLTVRRNAPDVQHPGTATGRGMPRSIVAAWLLFLTCLAAGCGPSRPATWPVRGVVTFEDGTPVQSGVVELLSDVYAETATGKIQPDGTFVLGTFGETDGACAGRHKVIVMQFIVNDGVTTHNRDHGPAVDLSFASYETSGLIAEIDPAIGNNELRLKVRRQRPLP